MHSNISARLLSCDNVCDPKNIALYEPRKTIIRANQDYSLSLQFLRRNPRGIFLQRREISLIQSAEVPAEYYALSYRQKSRELMPNFGAMHTIADPYNAPRDMPPRMAMSRNFHRLSISTPCIPAR